MKTLYQYFIYTLIFIIASCQDNEIFRESLKIQPIAEEALKGNIVGEDYVWLWPAQNGLRMEVTVYAGNTKKEQVIVDGQSFAHKGFASNVEYSYVFKLTDGTNFSSGVIRRFKYEAPDRIKGLTLQQIEKDGQTAIQVSWDFMSGLERISIEASDGKNTVKRDIEGDETTFVVENVGLNTTWNVKLIGINVKGTSFPVSASITIGKTAIGFLGIYPTVDEFVSKGDDDEVSSWLWLKQQYPSADYLYFGDLTADNQLDKYRVLFWLRDVEGAAGEDAVWNMPEVAMMAVPTVQAYYKNGGNLLLWGHSVPYISTLGRIDAEMLKKNDHVIGFGRGGMNNDPWSLAVELYPGKKFKLDMSAHPIYKGLEVSTNENTKLIHFIGPGWKEDHNCVFFNLPKALTGLENIDRACYDKLIADYGIYPLGVWDSQIEWISQFNIWEVRQANTDYKGTVLCIGNGGCEFSMNNPDGSKDVSANPKNNIYQANILKFAANCLEYLKTR